MRKKLTVRNFHRSFKIIFIKDHIEALKMDKELTKKPNTDITANWPSFTDSRFQG